MNWYYAREGRQVGPLSEGDLEAQVAAGVVRSDTCTQCGRASSCSATSRRIPAPSSSSPPDATEGIADEQYVRNVVDIVFRTIPGRPS